MSEEQHESESETGADADMGSTGHDEHEQQSEPQAEESADTGGESEGTDWKAEAEKWKALARKHEEGSDKVRGEVDELREQLGDRDAERLQAQSSIASERLHTKLARAGMSEDDATALIEHIDPQRLIEDGKPSVTAIDQVAASLSRSLTRGVDDDQGQASETPSFSPDQWLRKKARR